MSQAQIEPAAFPINGVKSYLGLGTTSVYKLIAEGKLEVRKYGKKTLVMRESCDRFLAGLPKFGEAA